MSGSTITQRNYLKTDSVRANRAFLSHSCMTRLEALDKMSAIERLIFEHQILLRPLLPIVTLMSSVPQKSKLWQQVRRGRITGSVTAACVGHNPNKSAVRMGIDFSEPNQKRQDDSDLSADASPLTWGSGKEVYAQQVYVSDLQGIVTKEFRKQRLEHYRNVENKGKPMESFVFRNQTIPIGNRSIHRDPLVELCSFSFLVDTQNHWRGVSPDGVVMINGVVVGCIEIKCPFAKKKKLHSNTKTYYYDQMMNEIYMVRQYWGNDVKWIDSINWSPDGFTVDTLPFDAQYFFSWYLPRELRFYFGLALPLAAQRLRNQVIATAENEKVDLASLNESALQKRFINEMDRDKWTN